MDNIIFSTFKPNPVIHLIRAVVHKTLIGPTLVTTQTLLELLRRQLHAI